MTVRWTVRATEPTAVFSPQRKYKTVGSRSRLPPRSVLLCCAQRCPQDTRTLPPQPKMRTEKDIGAEKSETTAVSGFCYAIF